MLREAVRRLGWSNGLLYAVDRAAQRLSGARVRVVKYILVAQPVTPTRFSSSSPRSAIEVSRTASDAAIVRSFPRQPSVIDWRFRDDGICFTATKSGKFVGFLWLHDHPYQEDEVNCLFAPMPQHLAVWDYDVYVEPEFRAGRAFVRLWSAAHDYLRERGVRWTMSRISAFNPGSLGAHERMGARRVGSAFFLCLGSFQVASLTTGPRLHFSRVGGRPPVARIPVPDAALDAEAHACPPRGVGASGPSAQIEAVRDGEGR